MLNINNFDTRHNQINPTVLNSALDFFLTDEPILILNQNFDIVFINDAFKFSELHNYYFDENSENFNQLKNNIKLFSESSFNYSRLNVSIFSKDENRKSEYLINISRINFQHSEIYLLKFIDAIKLLERENRIASIQTALEMMKIPLIITSSKGNIIYLSEEFERIFDQSLENLHNKFFCLALEKYLSKEDLLSLESSFLSNKFWNKTFQISSKSGKTHHYEIKFLPTNRFINGDNLNVLIILDITNHIEKKIEAEALADRISSILDSIIDPVFIVKDCDNYLSLERANKSFFDLFNISSSKLGTNIEKFLDRNLFDFIVVNINSLKNSDKSFIEFDYSLSKKYYKIKLSSLTTSQNELIFIITMNNITQEIEYHNKINEAYKKETHLNKLKTAFIENISHEIRTPFHAISGYSELIDDAIKNEDYGTIQEITFLMKDVLGRVTKLFDNLIELSHIESKSLIFVYSNINPNKVVKIVYESLIKKAIEKGIQLLLDLGDFKGLIRVDPKKLEKIISSLVDNSIKYTHYGNVIVRTYQQSGKVYISITDTGEGMNQIEINEFLQPFSQEEDTFTRKYQGMGLGLTVAYRLTKMLGGEIEIISQKSVGTKVILSFDAIDGLTK